MMKLDILFALFASLFVAGCCASNVGDWFSPERLKQQIIDEEAKRIRDTIDGLQAEDQAELSDDLRDRFELTSLEARSLSGAAVARTQAREKAGADSSETRSASEEAARVRDAELVRTTRSIAERTSREAQAGATGFHGLNFGIAPGIKFGGRREVKKAQIIDNGGGPLLRVTDQNDDEVGLLLETHYFVTPCDNHIGFGPFLALQTANDEVLDGLGFGLMIGFRYDEKSSRAFNIGIGRFLDNDVQVLASGFEDGQAPPGGATEVQFREQDVWRNVLMFSFSFGF